VSIRSLALPPQLGKTTKKEKQNPLGDLPLKQETDDLG